MKPFAHSETVRRRLAPVCLGVAGSPSPSLGSLATKPVVRLPPMMRWPTPHVAGQLPSGTRSFAVAAASS